MILIEDMPPGHAGNAAEKMIRDAGIWAYRAGYNGRTSAAFLANQPLVQALANRAAE
jgi:hypothetical protein